MSSAKPPFGSGGVPLQPVLAPVDYRLQLDAELVVAGDVDVWAADAAARGHAVGFVLDRELALHLQLAAVGDGQLGGEEADLRVAVAVEEIGGFQVTGEVLVLDDDRVDVDRSLQARRAVLAGEELSVVILEASAKRRDDHVLDGEPNMRVDRVDLPCSRCDLLCGGCAHLRLLILGGCGPQSV